MSDEMINKTSPITKKGVPGIGDTVSVHYNEYNMNKMNDPIEAPDLQGKRSYTKGQPANEG